jgi:hypothetical protein
MKRKRKTRSAKSAREVPVEILEFQELSDSEEQEKLRLERLVEKSFYVAGKALKQLRDGRFYRNNHKTFEAYCQDRFSYTRRSVNYLIAAADVVENLGTNGSQIFPTAERQVRPLTSLEPVQQSEAWQQAVSEAGGKVPVARIVKEVVQRITARQPAFIPFEVGEVCAILPKDNPELRGKGGCWCIVSAVGEFSCTVNTYDNEYQLRPEYLKSLDFTEFECKQIEDIGVRMTQLYQTGELEEVALGVLNKLARIDRAYLTDLEKQLLTLLEQKYHIAIRNHL